VGNVHHALNVKINVTQLITCVCNIFLVGVAQALFGLNLKYTYVSSIVNVDNAITIDKLQVVNFQTCYYGFFLQASNL
jgi:hypothetical protein